MSSMSPVLVTPPIEIGLTDISAATEQQYDIDIAAQTDQSLVALAQSGCTIAFDELVNRYKRECIKRAFHIMRNSNDAEDQVQNAYWKAFASIGQFRGEGTFGAWLCRIVENQCYMTFRKPRCRYLSMDITIGEKGRIELVSQDMGPEDILGREEVIEVLRREVSQLPLIMREVIMLCDLEENSLQQAAAALGISIPATKSRLARARIELRSRALRHAGKMGAAILTKRSIYSAMVYSSGGPPLSTVA